MGASPLGGAPAPAPPGKIAAVRPVLPGEETGRGDVVQETGVKERIGVRRAPAS